MKRVSKSSKIVPSAWRQQVTWLFPPRSGSKGFLLIAVLLLLSLLTVLVVASVMIAQLERRAATNGESNQLAQQNALFALNVALGQLQREAGPDQRVTARADILSTTPGPTASNGATAYWTGVWKTYNPSGGLNQQLDVTGTTTTSTNTMSLRAWSTGTTTGASGGPHWLISNPSNTPLSPASYAGAGGITVANVGTAGGTPVPVTVPLVPMKTTRTLNNSTSQVQTGQYAYWVSDEGIKAKANLVDPNIGINPSNYLVDSQRQFLAPAANAVFKVLSYTPSTSPAVLNNGGNDIRTNSFTSRVIAPLSLQYMTTGSATGVSNGWTASNVSSNMADITTYSMGVLADVRKGGLKTDLTAAFESASNCKTLFPYNGLVGTGTGTYDTQNVYRAYAGAEFSTTPNYGQTISVADAIAVGTTGTYTNFDGYATTTGALFDGLPWQTLFYFYNLYRTTSSTSTSHIPTLSASTTGSQTNSTTNPSVYPYGGNSINYLTSPTASNGAAILPMTPVVLETRMDLSITPTYTSAGLWSATLTAYPQVVLWNPYSVPLNPPTGYSFNNGSLVFRDNALWCWIGNSPWGGGTGTGTITTGTVTTTTPQSVGPGCTAIALNNSGVGNGRNNLYTLPESAYGLSPALPFLPGEIRVYALTTTPSVPSLETGAGTLISPPATDGSSGSGNILNFTSSGTSTGTNEPTSYSASTTTPSMSGDNGQSVTFQIGDGIHDNQGNVINTVLSPPPPGVAGTELFHVALGIVFPSGSGVAKIPFNLGFTAGPNNDSCYYFGGLWTRSILPTTAAWPLNNVNASRLGTGAQPDIVATPLAVTGAPNDQQLLSGSSGGEFRVASYMIRMKGLQSPASPTSTSWVNGKYAAPMFMGNSSSFNLLCDAEYGCSNYEEIYGLALNANTDDSIVESPNSLDPNESGTLWGTYSAGDVANIGTPGAGGAGANASTNNVVLYDIPNQPMISLGQFMHMPIYLFNATNTFDYLPGAAMFVGGSLACPEVPLNETANILYPSGGGNEHYVFDNSFMANQALFDSYFFSTVPPSGGFGFATTPSGLYSSVNTAFSNTSNAALYIKNNYPLPNGRMRYYLDNMTPSLVAPRLQNPYLAAANLLVDGAFNVNSTSVPAWTAFLSSLNGNQLQLWNASSGSTSSYPASTTQTYFPRFWSGTSGATSGPWDGSHPLTDTQITALAHDIVDQVKLRGPFLSMGDFLNRRLYSGSASLTATTGSIGSLYTAGALQAAIDTGTYSGTSTINSTALSYGTPLTASNTFTVPYNLPTALIGYNAKHLSQSAYPLPSLTTIVSNTAVGIPAYLMQQDIVQALAPVMTVRSDTFVIRVYGEADNPSTKAVEGRAWGEAVVQRLPDYVDQTDPALTTAPSTTSAHVIPPITSAIGNATPIYDSTGAPILDATNQTFGRRFKIVSFHWLNPNDI